LLVAAHDENRRFIEDTCDNAAYFVQN